MSEVAQSPELDKSAQPSFDHAPTTRSQVAQARKSAITIGATFVLCVYLFVSLQFAESGVQFIPRDAVTDRYYSIAGTTALTGDVQEHSFFQWPTNFEKAHDDFVREIKNLGFKETQNSMSTAGIQLGDQVFKNDAGDVISLGPKWEVASRGTSITTGRKMPKHISATQAQFVFTHIEKRAGPAFLKRMIVLVKSKFK